MATHPAASEVSDFRYLTTAGELFEKARLADREELWTKLSLALLAFCSLGYFFAAVWTSVTNPLWMDEVMASWMAQLHFTSIPAAILGGTMSSPPTYFYLLKIVRSVLGGSSLALRLPSILGVYGTGLAVFFLMRRRFAVPFAALAMVLCLEAGLFSYATQIREYALVTVCFALATLLWSSLAEPLRLWRVAAITLLLAACVSLHFYGVLLVPALGLMELLWSIANRRIRPAVWIGFILAGGSIFAWFPLMRRTMKITGRYAASAHYFAQPTLSRLMMAYEDLAFGGKLPILACFFLVGMALFFFWEKAGNPKIFRPVKAQHADASPTLEIIILATVLIPLIVFLFARFFTGTFNERYAIAGSLGFAMLAALLIAGLRIGAQMSAALLFCSALLLVTTPRRLPPTDHFGIQLLERTADSDPIVVGEGLAFLEMEAAADPALQKRLVYLTLPPGEVNPDPTNEDLVKRWRQFRPDLNVEDPQQFLTRNSHFYVLHSSESTDVITPWLIRTRRLTVKWNKPAAKDGDDKNVWLFEAAP